MLLIIASLAGHPVRQKGGVDHESRQTRGGSMRPLQGLTLGGWQRTQRRKRMSIWNHRRPGPHDMHTHTHGGKVGFQAEVRESFCRKRIGPQPQLLSEEDPSHSITVQSLPSHYFSTTGHEKSPAALMHSCLIDMGMGCMICMVDELIKEHIILIQSLSRQILSH